MLRPLEEWKARVEEYGAENGPFADEEERRRYLSVLEGFEERFGKSPACIFSSPGRVELSGNHTDHQQGCVLAAAVSLDMLAAAAPNGAAAVRIFSEGYGYEETDLSELSKIPGEEGSSRALVRGIAFALKSRGFSPWGFDAYISSHVPQGSGLSSSAAFELLIGKIFSELFCGDALSPLELALIGRFAENEYFGKPCGLMDQLSCSVGGLLFIDFKKPESPEIRTLYSGFEELGHSLFITNAGGSHAGLTHEYASIASEMRAVSELFGKDSLRGLDEGEFYERLPFLRNELSDRAILRAMHFFAENRRVRLQFEALSRGDMPVYLRLMDESGRSSQELLQNVYPCGNEKERSLSLALSLSRGILGESGAVRVHGGGFAGTVLALVPEGKAKEYKTEMDRVFGKDACTGLSLRPTGVMALE